MTSAVKIAAINVNSIVSINKRNDLLNFTNTHNLDIVLIGETKLSERHRIYFNNHDFIRTDRKSNKGVGTAILIKNTLPYNIVSHPSCSDNVAIEYTIVNIVLGRLKLLVVSLYAGGRDDRAFINELDRLVEELKLTHPYNYFLIAGDFNAKHTQWGNPYTRTRGRMLSGWIDARCITTRMKLHAPILPTFPSANSSIDLCLADCRLNFTDLIDDKIKTLDYNSDHLALCFTVSIPCELNSIDPSDSHHFSFKKTKWPKFTTYLQSNYIHNIPTNRNLTNTEIDRNITTIADFIMNAIKNIVPKYKPSNNFMIYSNTTIKKLHKYKSFLISLRNKFYRNPAHINSLIDLDSLKFLINLTNHTLNNEYKKSQTKYWDCVHSKINYKNSETFFPQINRFFRPKKPLKIETITINRENSYLCPRINLPHDPINHVDKNINDPKKVLDFIGAYYETINAPRYTNIGSRVKQLVDARVNVLKRNFNDKLSSNASLTTFSDNNPANRPTSLNDHYTFTDFLQIFRIIKCLPNKTSCSLDNIPPIVLKHLPPTIIQSYTIIFNNCINNGYFPIIWKKVKILPILKKNKPPNLPSSYRPISLTPANSKVYESVINNLVSGFTYSREIIPHNQFGFKFKHSTCHALHKFSHIVNSHLHHGNVVGACLIDLEKAFDSVWNDGLLYILDNKKYPEDLIQTIWSMISDRSFVVWNGSVTSDFEFSIREGLMQGTVNSPILFNIFTHKICSLNVFNNRPDAYSLAFADDLVLLAAGRDPLCVESHLQDLVNAVDRHYRL
ncbi:hypothetical protein TKK_0019402 [Trichogramma kaykai]